jgi:AbrB family looped-hinge helix DNA binding protein
MRVTSKGQVTIPKHLRQRTGIRPGAEVDFSERDGEVVVKKAAKSRRPAADDFEAYLDRVTGIVDLGMTTDDFMELLRGE